MKSKDLVVKIEDALNQTFNGSKSGIFATYNNVAEATDYIKQLLTSCTEQTLNAMIGVSLGIYHNTLLSQLQSVLVETLEGAKVEANTADSLTTELMLNYMSSLEVVLDCYRAQIPTPSGLVDQAADLISWTKEGAEQRYRDSSDDQIMDVIIPQE